MADDKPKLTMADRVIRRAHRHTLAATVLANVPANELDKVIIALEQFAIRGLEVACLYSHVCDGDIIKFVDYIGKLAERPTDCPNPECGATWQPAKPDESHIFGPKRKESEYMCAMADCETEAPWACSRCYIVRYCSAACQQLDYPRHKDECLATVSAIKDAAKFGKAYARGIFKGTLSIGDKQFDSLWQKWGK